MGLYDSGYERVDNDLYPTPEYVTEAIVPMIPRLNGLVWEPAAGAGAMARVLARCGCEVFCSDIEPQAEVVEGAGRIYRHDFINDARAFGNVKHIFTNPPFSQATAFVQKALSIIKETDGVAVMLLPATWDFAPGRHALFRDHPAFAAKWVLTRRIVWFDEPVPCRTCGATGVLTGVSNASGPVKCGACYGKGTRKPAPKEHHAAFVWHYRHQGPPQTGWIYPERIIGPAPAVEVTP